jgi:hypothetical protein
MSEINENLRHELLAMIGEDERVRTELAATGELFEGYHPKMEAVHLDNAARLEELIEQYGWIRPSLVGEEAAKAAWRILQHAISRPDFQRRGLEILQLEAEAGEIPLWQVAYLEDRIASFEGKPQRYGTQFDWNEDGELSPGELAEPDKIDELRASIGLEPMSERIAQMRESIKSTGEKPPAELLKRKQEFEKWARTVGWRK